MPIKFLKDSGTFYLTTKNTAYAFSILWDKFLMHQHYGKKTSAFKRVEPKVVSFSPYTKKNTVYWSHDVFPQEYSFFGSGDFRLSALKLRGKNGSCATDFMYSNHKIIKGRPQIEGLPFARADEATKTLEITMVDRVSFCALKLYYTVFYNEDVISRYMVLENLGEDTVKIEKCMSLTLDLPRSDYDMISLWGSANAERQYQRVPLHHGVQSVFSRRGVSSHQYNPFFALCDKNASETKGEVYGFNFVYSGSFANEVEVDQINKTRVCTGLGEECFGYTLEPGESFMSPEAVMTYSGSGIGTMTRNFHKFTRDHIMPEYAKKPHPVVLNTWEACYFDIDEDVLVDFADEAAKTGFHMLVMDDGWFGNRCFSDSSLGDWYPTPSKFKNGLAPFVNKVVEKGIEFGIWIEPEMVNPKSELYCAHPDWCIAVPHREPALSREQLVLDMTNPQVLEYLKESFKKVFAGLPITYFKWDMNRNLCDLYSPTLSAQRQDEVAFRYMKGVYSLLSWFREEFPNAIIETCSGGGGRYDLGMMQYGVQIWASDNTNPYSRLKIQRSSLLCYPALTMSCHVSNPEDSLSSLDFRYKVAVGGMLGYELNILKMNDEIKAEIRKQIKQYETFEHLIREGEYYCAIDPNTHSYGAYYYANEDRSEILFTFAEQKGAAGKTKHLRIREAVKGATYKDMLSGEIYTADVLRAGLVYSLGEKENNAVLLYLVRV